MRSAVQSPRINGSVRRPGSLALAVALALTAIAASPQDGAARVRRAAKAVETVAPRVAGPPIMAIVSLADQNITIYDADGWMMRAPVSTGEKGRETPAGVFSVIEKQAEHYSNLYDDAAMPHMQRLTWSGIALHGGPLPGRPASHGCIRLPYGFAERLFDKTRLGMRVIIAPAAAAPVDIVHPLLFSPPPTAERRAAELADEAVKAARIAEEARLAAANATRDAARLGIPVRTLERKKLRADAELAAAERALRSAKSEAASRKRADARAKAAADVIELERRLTIAETALQPMLEKAAHAKEAAVATETARQSADAAAREAARALAPVSVYVSRKTQRLYVRRGFEPLFDSPVTIRDADRAIGTHVFTAMARTDAGLRWSVASLQGGSIDRVRTAELGRRGDGGDSTRATDTAAANAALDRIVIPPDVLDRLAVMATPRSLIVVSDEPLSSETGKGTEFVAVLSDHPKGSMIVRRRAPTSGYREARPRYRTYYYGRPAFGVYYPRW